MQRGKGGREMSDTDAAEANRRAEWLHKHKAPKDWIVLTTSEVSVIREELLAVERERDEARELAQQMSESNQVLMADVRFYRNAWEQLKEAAK
jgi:hypothetical protein